MANKNPNPKNFEATNLKNLSPEARREIARKGAEATNKIKAEKKTMRAMLDYLLEKSAEGQEATNLEAMMVGIIKKAVAGDVAAAAFVRDTTGQKPAEKNINHNTDEKDKTFKDWLEGLK